MRETVLMRSRKSADPASPMGLRMRGVSKSGPGHKALGMAASTTNAAAHQTTHRQRGDSSRPEGNRRGMKINRMAVMGIQFHPPARKAIASPAGQGPPRLVPAKLAEAPPARLKVTRS